MSTTPARRSWFFWFQLAVVALLLAALVWFKGDDFVFAVKNFDVGYLLISFVIYFVCVLTTFYRWYLLVRAQDLPFTIPDAIRLGFVGIVSSLFTPGSITGDFIKAGFLAREQKRRTVAAMTIAVDRIIGLYALFLLTSLASIWYWDDIAKLPRLQFIMYVIWGITIGVALSVVPMFLFRAEPFIRWLETLPGGHIAGELVRALRAYRYKPGIVGLALLLGMVGHVGFVLSFHFSALAVPPTDKTPSWEMHFLIIPVYMVLQAVPLAPAANLGVGEWILDGLYQLVGKEYTKGAFVSLAQRVVVWATALVGLIWYIPLRQAMRKRQAAMGNGEVPADEKPAEEQPPALAKEPGA